MIYGVNNVIFSNESSLYIAAPSARVPDDSIVLSDVAYGHCSNAHSVICSARYNLYDRLN